MTMIEPTRRPDSGPPRLHERSDADSQFGAELNAAVARRGPERNLRARRLEEDRAVAERPPGAERAADEAGATDSTSTDSTSTDSTSTDAVDAPATSVAETGDEPVGRPNDAVSTASPGGSTVTADEPRINNGGVCSCCTPGAFRPVLPPATVASAQVAAIPLETSAALDDGSTPAPDAGFPPPRPFPAPGMPPPGGPPAPLQPPVLPVPAAPATDGVMPVALAQAASVTEVPSDLESEETAATDPDDLRVANTPVAGDPTMAALAAVPVPQQPAPTTSTAAATSPTTTAVTGVVAGRVVAGSVTAGVATSKDAGTEDSTDGDEPTSRARDDAALPGTSAQQTGADLAASRITTSSSQPVSTPVAPLRGQSVSEGVLRSEQVRVLRELAPNRDVQRLAVDLDGARVALRFDSTGARVDVVADPGNRLGQGWADDVQRTLNAGARHGANSQQRDPDGGRRNRQAYQAPNQVDERLAAEFSARLGAVEEG